jgi:type VI secretion system secreted protein VgrG
MSTYTQEDGLFKIDTPLGKDVLLLKGFKGREGISQLFRFELDLLSENSSIPFPDIVGKNVTISLKREDGSYRYFNGIISRFAQDVTEEQFTSYRAEMVPWLWFLTRNADCRVFQDKSMPDIVTKLFRDLNFNDYTTVLRSSYKEREYCVQYRESDFHFVSRLMEECGIFYFFKHEHGKHTLVLADAPTAHSPCPGQSSFRYVTVSGGPQEDVIAGWQIEQELRTGKYSLEDYNFQTPSTNLMASSPTVYVVGENTRFEVYDYPGEYLTIAEGDSLAKVRMQEEEAGHLVAHGTSQGRELVSGYKFTLEGHPRQDMNTDYVLTEMQHAAVTDTYGTSRSPEGESYSNTFTCIPLSVPFRPSRVTPRPGVKGPQTAVVVGPSSEEIYTDKYGRVRVQFFWDRLYKKNEKSTCWVRVSQLWAGKNWGAMFLPRIGQEVIVDFLEGDPDQPIITGRVYNDEQKPPGTLPDNQNISGFRSRSTKGGGAHDANVLTFDDTKGSEVFYMRAQKDMAVRVENNDDLKVLNDQTITIHNNRTEVVEQGNEKITIKQGNRDVTVSMGNDSLTISMGSQTTEAMQSIELKVGQSSVKLDQMGVTIKGMMIQIEGQIQTQIKAVMTQVNGDAMLTLKGGITMIN